MNSPTAEEEGASQFAFWLRFWRWVVAIEQIGGGLFGIYVAAYGRLLGNNRVVLLLAFTVFVAAVWGGILLALKRPGGVAASLVVQALQLVQVATVTVLYSFVCGLQIAFCYLPLPVGPEIGFQYFLGSRFQASYTPMGSAPISLTGINVVAALAILCLLYVRASERRLKSGRDAAMPLASEEGIWPPSPKP